MSKSQNLTYSGDIRAVVANGNQIAFVTEHVESFPTALYLINAESNKLDSISLPCGGLALAYVADTFWIGGTDGKLYSAVAKDKSATECKTQLPCATKKIIPLTDSEFACLCGNQVVILDAKGKLTQALTLEQDGAELEATAIDVSGDGEWLAVGCLDGNVFVFQREEAGEFEPSDSAQLHHGEVTSILFEPEELRFFSAGADQKLLLTHARGTLEPEDRGRANNHKERVVAMVLTGEDRFITGSSDKTCKSWARVGATKPSTLSNGIIGVTGLAMATVHKRTTLVAAQLDNSIRLFLIDEAGKFGQASDRYNDQFQRAKDLFASNSTADRGAALHELATLDDLAAIKLIFERISADSDVKLRQTAAELLCKSNHPRHQELLLTCLGNENESIRKAVFDYLSKSKTNSAELLELCKSSIDTGRNDIGCDALKVVEKLATSKNESDAFRNRARDLIVKSFGNGTMEIRRSAILTLESVFGKNSARPNLIALQSNQPDARRIGLIRLMKRNLLSDDDALAGIRQKIEDQDPDVRKTATLLLILSRKKLADAIRARDQDIDRQLSDLESFSIDVGESSRKKDDSKPSADEKSKPKKKSSKSKPELSRPKLSIEDQQPLLIAVSARAMDTCLIGAKCLALLEDPRAFGLLMQLSREDNNSARVEVCKSLAALGDPRANDRISSMLADGAVEVRDAAYTALTEIRSDNPLAAAADGLAASAEDVRRRALETLVQQIRKSKSKTVSEDASLLLRQALNDEATSVRSEAFKIVLNSKVDGGEDHSLRFALHSVHADVRREVLTEAMGQKKETWSRSLVLDLLDDPDKGIRSEAFEHLRKESKETDLGWLSDAVSRKFADIRELACKRLVRNHTVAARKILLGVINDENESIRELVLKSLIDADAVEQLHEALKSQRVDVRLGAAHALARRGDQAAREILVEVIAQKKPTAASMAADLERFTSDGGGSPGLESLQANWQSNVAKAYRGLARLGDPTTLDSIIGNLNHDDNEVRTLAASASAWIVREESLDQIGPFRRHSDEGVRSNLAFAAALAGDPVSVPTIFSNESKSLEPIQRTAAAVVLREKTEGRLIAMLDLDDAIHRNIALIVLLCRDQIQHDGSPRRTINCLAARDPRVRLFAAKAVEAFSDPDLFSDVLGFVFNDRGDQKPWTISSEVISQISAIISHGSNHLLARLVWILSKLGNEKQTEWDDEWSHYSERFKDEIDAAVAKVKPAKIAADQDSLYQLAFGTYVGLAREQGSYHQQGTRPGFGAAIINIRAAAVRQLVGICQQEKSFLESTVSVLTQTTGDPNQIVRQLAFEELKTLGVPDERRAAIAIETGHRDLAVAGLTLLTKSGAKSKQKEVLTNVIMTRNDEIAFEAAKLLKEQMDEVAVCKICFDSPYMRLPGIALSWLGANYDSSDDAKKIIRSLALESEDAQIQTRAIRTLVSVHDESAFEALTKSMETDDEKIRLGLLPMFGHLDDPRSADFLLDLLAENSQLDGKLYLTQVGNTRNTAAVDRMIGYFEAWANRRDGLFLALLKISGFDQQILDPNDLNPDQAWLDKQLPRHDDVLAKLLVVINRFGTVNQLKKLVPSARWAKGSDVDEPLASLAIHPDEGLRHSVVEAIGFRAKKRNGDTKALSEALAHRDPITKFLGADGLAKSGNADGIQVLLTAIELMEDLRYRKRAVLSLGRLADERAYEVLIRLATEHGHALQDSAAESIGHLRDSDNKGKIIETLLRLVNSEGSAGRRALVGLRWMDLPDGWDKIREVANSDDDARWLAVEQLGFDNSQTSKDLLLTLIETQVNQDFVLGVARRAWGEESVAPDIAWAKTAPEIHGGTKFNADQILKRLRDTATPTQIFDLFRSCPEYFRERLMHHVLQIDPLPVEIALNNLGDTSPRVVEAAAWVIGRNADDKHAKQICATLAGLLAEAKTLSAEMVLANRYFDEKLDSLMVGIKRLLWAANALGGCEKEIAEVVVNHSANEHLSSVRKTASKLLAQLDKIPANVAKMLESIADESDSYVRQRVAEVLAKAPKAKLDPLAQTLISDRSAFAKFVARSAGEIAKTLQSAAADAHYQPRALSYLVESSDVKTLGAVANDVKLDQFARTGAVEGLSQIANKESDKLLEAIGKNEDFEEDLRKAAWKALRRSKRKRVVEAAS